MIAAMNSSAWLTGLAAPMPAAASGRITSAGDGRQVAPHAIDGSRGPASRGASTRSAVVAGPSTTLVQERPPHASPATSVAIPTSSLMILQGESSTPFRALVNGVASAEAYAVTLPAEVEVVHRPAAQIRQVTGVGYFTEVGDTASQRASTVARVDELKALARIETDLAAGFGEPVKLAWDDVAGEHVILRPGDEGYDRVMGARDLLGRLGRDLKTLQLFTPEEIERLSA
ncbi:hypothetical protein [Brevundimonas sp. A19_0]|uniref:hypothetical protein n=1 Tax=Brevundimonas sp. A19_0 TaxID=2821087 RepID=UPI001ADCA637|nr:hypothetical protein [Brevundimonas sp. A19_0]MBO9501762.1 hypothetical protein [Brevundimonas sp. A19_0]